MSSFGLIPSENWSDSSIYSVEDIFTMTNIWVLGGTYPSSQWASQLAYQFQAKYFFVSFIFSEFYHHFDTIPHTHNSLQNLEPRVDYKKELLECMYRKNVRSLI